MPSARFNCQRPGFTHAINTFPSQPLEHLQNAVNQIEVCARKQVVEHQQTPSTGGVEEQEGILGLQSKMSVSHKLGTRMAIVTKSSTTCEGAVTRCVSEKEVGSCEQTSSKTHRASISSARCRKVLLNKIEDIKQKYYERQLEIEIYQDENEYEEQLQRITHPQCPEESVLPHLLVKDVSNIKQHIIDKLRKRKINQETSAQKSKNIDITANQALELHSSEGEGVRQSEDFLKQSGMIKQVKGGLNKVKRELQQEDKAEDRVSFSEYSQQDTLQEIRECDEDEEDYKSRMESRAKIDSRARLDSRRSSRVLKMSSKQPLDKSRSPPSVNVSHSSDSPNGPIPSASPRPQETCIHRQDLLPNSGEEVMGTSQVGRGWESRGSRVVLF